MSDTDRRAVIACDIDEEPCGPPGRECDEGRRCPHHGGGPYDDEDRDQGYNWNAADEAELREWWRRTA